MNKRARGLLLFRFTTCRLCDSSPLLVKVWCGELPRSFIVCKWVCVSLCFRSFLLRTRSISIHETLTIIFFTLRPRSPRGHVGLTFHNPSVKWWLEVLSLFLNQNYNLGRLKINSIPNATQWAKVQIIFLLSFEKSVKLGIILWENIFFYNILLCCQIKKKSDSKNKLWGQTRAFLHTNLC